jgi:STAS-like domain of unknown function (DUF4325)
MSKIMFSIAKQYTRFPGPRYARQGPHSGETLRKKLGKMLRGNNSIIVIDLDDTNGYGSSFLDEAFGGLVRSEELNPSDLRRRLSFKSDTDPSYIEEIWQSIGEATAPAA